MRISGASSRTGAIWAAAPSRESSIRNGWWSDCPCGAPGQRRRILAPVCCGRQCDLNVQSAVWPGVGLGVAAVCPGHRCDDGQAEPGAWLVAGPAGEAAERLEQLGYLVGGDVLTAVR